MRSPKVDYKPGLLYAYSKQSNIFTQVCCSSMIVPLPKIMPARARGGDANVAAAVLQLQSFTQDAYAETCSVLDQVGKRYLLGLA